MHPKRRAHRSLQVEVQLLSCAHAWEFVIARIDSYE